MTVIEEFKAQNKAGKTVILQKIGKGISYLDFGSTHLPRDFEGYKIKYSDRIVQPQDGNNFLTNDSKEVFSRI